MAKRGADDVSGDWATKKPRVEDDGLQTVRVLISKYEASSVIGKAGANVKKLRLESGAFVSILRVDAETKERVLQVKGAVENNTAALIAIAGQLINQANDRKAANGSVEVDNNHVFKLLVHKSLVGAIIGKGGAFLKAIQSEVGVRVSIGMEPLPGSSEKTMSLTGTVDQLHSAISRILAKVSEEPPRTNNLYVPGQAFSGTTAAAALPAGFGMQAALPQQQQGLYGGYGGMGGMGMAAPAPIVDSSSKTEKIVIPTICAGTVIGKSGSIIREINAQSGTKVSVAAAEPTAPDDRVVSITGPPSGIQVAIYLIRQRVESYQPPALGM